MFPNLIAHHIYRGEPIPLPDGRAYDYLLAGNGLFIRAATRFWNARLPVASFLVRGLPPLTTAFHLKTARLSSGVLCELIRHARQRRGDDGRLLESLYRVCPMPERPRIIWPAQTASPGSVSTQSDRPAGTRLEIHSHGALPAFWSATDDRDEQGACIYGVMGRLHTDIPEVRLRLVSTATGCPSPSPTSLSSTTSPSPSATLSPTRKPNNAEIHGGGAEIRGD